MDYRVTFIEPNGGAGTICCLRTRQEADDAFSDVLVRYPHAEVKLIDGADNVLISAGRRTHVP